MSNFWELEKMILQGIGLYLLVVVHIAIIAAGVVFIIRVLK